MGEKLEKQFLVSRATKAGYYSDQYEPLKPWVWFDSRKLARVFVKEKEAKSDKWLYRIDSIHRGPKA